MTLTPQQLQAVETRGNVLVSAGAGTGKTRTLVERCLHFIETGISIDQVLMVTFTEAAAAEMKHRIRAALQERAANQPQQSRWAEQEALVEVASISTLHAFCHQQVRRHFFRLGLDPQMVVLDENQTNGMIEESLDELTFQAYAAPEKHRSILGLIQKLGDEEPLRKLILKIHRFRHSLPNPQQWLDQQKALCREETPAHWWKAFQESCVDLAAEGLNKTKSLEENEKAGSIAAHLSLFMTRGDFSMKACRQLLERLVEEDREWPRGKKTAWRTPLKKFFEGVEFLFSQCAVETSGKPGLDQDWEQARENLAALLSASAIFSENFAARKREMGGMDFSDLEQFTLSLLYSNGKANELAQELQEQFEFVFVDEYQDINAAQDAILMAVSRQKDGGNRFLVGDIKQSIYRFRLANPAIFAGYEERWSTGSGKRLYLSENFRSCESVLLFVNQLFSFLIGPGLGGVHYPPDAELKFGDSDNRSLLSTVSDVQARVEIHCIPSRVEQECQPGEEESDSEVQDLEASEREAHVIADRLAHFAKEEIPVFDPELGAMRPVAWGDMVILMRSIRGRTETFAKVFHQRGIPLSAPRPGFFSAQEIQDLLGVLRLLDNPMQDIPLLGVLHSPLAGLSAAELAAFRSIHRDLPIWLALKKFGGSPLKSEATPEPLSSLLISAHEKARRFLSSFEDWRCLVRQVSVSACMESILRDTGYDVFLESHYRGSECLANINRLLEMAHRYDPWQRQGLFRFLKFVDRQMESNREEEEAEIPDADAVRMMTIHASKGLEFPVVVLAGMGTQFNQQFTREAILLDEAFGLCPKVISPEGDRRYPSQAFWRAREKEAIALRAEEMRLLYVGLTRARDWLLLTGIVSEKCLQPDWGVKPEEEPSSSVAQAKRCFDWIRLWLEKSSSYEEAADGNSGIGGFWSWKIHRLQSPTFEKNHQDQKKESIPLMEGSEKTLMDQFAWRYSHLPCTREPAKTSISALRKRFEQEESHVLFRSPRRIEKKSRMTGAEIGVAYHKFFERMDLGECSLTSFANQLEELKGKGILSQEESEAIDCRLVAEFWQGKIGSEIRCSGGELRREVGFHCKIQKEDWVKIDPEGLVSRSSSGPGPGEFVVVQGVVDLLLLRKEDVWILDLKTDQVEENGLEEKLKIHRPQLRLYAHAMERILERPVSRLLLHFLSTGKTIELD